MDELIKANALGQWEVLEKSVYNTGTHPAKGYDPDKKMRAGDTKSAWHSLNHRIHALESSGKAGSDEHQKLVDHWEKETDQGYKPGMAGQEIKKSRRH